MTRIYYSVYRASIAITAIGMRLDCEWLFNLGGWLEYWADNKQWEYDKRKLDVS